MNADLDALRARVGAATGPDRELDEAIAFAVRWRPETPESKRSFAEHEAKHGYATAWIAHAPWRPAWPIPPWSASIDAALALSRRRLGENARMGLLVDPIEGKTTAVLAGSWNGVAMGVDVSAAARAIILAELEAEIHVAD